MLTVKAVAAWRMAPTGGLVARVLLERSERLAHRRPLLAPSTSISAEAFLEAKLRADRCIEEGFVLRRNPVWRPAPPIQWGKNPRQDSNWHYLINTFEPVEPLLHAYQCGAGEEYFLLARGVAIDWINYNLLRDAPNEKKWHDMATALRARVFARILDAELRRARPHPTIVARLVWALAKHAQFLADPKNLPTGNHALFMMFGLAHLLQALPELREVDSYRCYCRATLKQRIGSQFASDGFHLEHSPEYHLYLTEAVADIVENQLLPELPELSEVVRRARSHFHELFHPNGDLAMLGDSERCASQRHGPDPSAYLSQLSRMISAESPASQLHVYANSGYAVFRSHYGEWATPHDDYFLLGAGHHSRVHKHADHLSFEWSFRGVPVLIGSGKGTYDVDPWMRYFRSTRAGNAVEVDERNYDRTPRPGRCHIVAWGETGGVAYVVARHHSDRLDVTQTRALVTLAGQYLLVIDQLDGRDTHVYRQWFHLHEALSIEQRGDCLRVLDAKGECLLALQELTGQTSIELAKGQELPRKQGFVSPAYQTLIPRQAVAFCQRATTTTFVTLFAAEPANAREVFMHAGALSIRWWNAQGRGHAVRFRPEAAEPVERVDVSVG